MKKVLSLFLSIVLVLGVFLSVPFTGVPFEITAEAASVSDLTFKLNDDGESYYVSSCNSSASGALEIPNTYNGKPVTSIGEHAFYWCTSLTSITIPDSVTSMGEGAFWYCTSLTSITLPDSVTSIGEEAFGYCDSLESVIIPDSVMSIDDYAFYYCYSLTSITIPDSVMSIGDYAFEECRSLKSITIPDSVTSIGDYAFYWCESLTSITIPDSVTSIGEFAFGYCDSLESVTISDGVTSIGKYAFYSCESLTSITLPDSVTSIGKYAFDGAAYYNDSSNWENGVLYIGNHLIDAKTSISGSYEIKAGTKTIADEAFWYCRSLKSITIPDSVTSIGEMAFYECESLTSITLPDSVTSIGEGAFGSCTSLTEINISSSNQYYTSVDGVLFNKDKTELVQYPAGKTNTSYAIPDSVTSIDDYAFSWCESLETVTFGKGVTSIGNWAFSNCDSLTSITIPDSVTSIGDCAFEYCDSLTSITIPDSVMSIGWGAFWSCDSLTSITIPNSVTSIGSVAFDDCTSLTSITIPDSVTSIGGSAFEDTAYYNDSSNWENGVLYIGNHLIEAKTSISGSYEIKAGTKTIADYAFEYCDSLTSITIPDSVTSIGEMAFYECESLTSITLPDSVTSMGEGAFWYCTSLTSITIPDSVTSIGYRAFYWCTSLTSVTIGNSVTSIGDEAFYHCTSLKSITIPDSVTNIGWGAFRYCTSLLDVYYSGSSEDWSNISIGSYNDSLLNATIHYNNGSCSHTSTKWVTDKAATVNAAGSQHKECTACGAVLETAVIPQLKPSNPTLSKAANANGGVTVTWKAVSGADSYRVYRKTSSTSWTCLNSKVTSTSYTDKSAKSGTTYYYTVRAENEGGLSGYNSTGVSVKYLAMPTVTIANASTGVKVSWNKITGASKYYVYRKASGDKSWTQLTNSATGTSYTDTKAKSGTTYYYTVKAVSGSVASEYKSSSALKYLAQPKVSSLSNTNSGITVKWNKITGASGYYVYRKTGSGSWSLIYTVKSGSTVSYTDKSAKAGTTYYYTVRAYSGSVKSTYTSSSAVRRLTTPTLKSVSSAKSGITFKWSKVTGASGYYVYRKTGSGSWQKIATVKSGSTVSYLDKTAKKGTTYTYTVKAYYSSTVSAYNTTGLKIKDKY